MYSWSQCRAHCHLELVLQARAELNGTPSCLPLSRSLVGTSGQLGELLELVMIMHMHMDLRLLLQISMNVDVLLTFTAT